VMVGREAGESRTATREDPLARLDQLAQQSEGVVAAVTYPERLTGVQTPSASPAVAPQPTVAVTGVQTPIMAGATPTLVGSVTPPSQVTIRLAGAPMGTTTAMPGETMLPGVVTGPASVGSEGSFSVQVSSFRAVTSAHQFAQRLREKGHRAFVAPPATAPNGIVWHRVRIGPFTTQRDANQYRASFEARERMPTIVVRREQDTLRPVQTPSASVVPAPTLHAAVTPH
jgi:DedD protein